MNERIRELARQTGFTQQDLAHGRDQMLAEFAELIVRECARIATNPHLRDEESYYGNEFAKAIKKHFGIIDERTNSRTYQAGYRTRLHDLGLV